MKYITRHIPNALTLCNLLCGAAAVVFAFGGDFGAAFWAVAAGVAFDFADGLAARLLKAYSPLGVQLDSLADMVTSGVAPSAVLFVALGGAAEPWAWGAFALACGAALRLAKFNIDTEQTSEFRGLPTPAMSLFFVSYAFWAPYVSVWVSLGLVAAFVLLMTCRVPMFSLKFKSLDIKSNAVRYLFLALAAVSLAVWGIYLMPMSIITVYVLYSLTVWLIRR